MKHFDTGGRDFKLKMYQTYQTCPFRSVLSTSNHQPVKGEGNEEKGSVYSEE